MSKWQFSSSLNSIFHLNDSSYSLEKRCFNFQRSQTFSPSRKIQNQGSMRMYTANISWYFCLFHTYSHISIIAFLFSFSMSECSRFSFIWHTPGTSLSPLLLSPLTLQRLTPRTKRHIVNYYKFRNPINVKIKHIKTSKT